jgi:tryptophan halogenase
MLHQLARSSGSAPVTAFAIDAGRFAAPWQGRVVAIGDAAARCASLGNANLSLAAAQILLLLDLLPGGSAPFAEVGEYNRRATLLADDARDFVRCQQGVAGSHRLAQRIDQFRRRGWVPELAEGIIPLDHWAQLLTGLGYGPGTLPRAAAMPAEALAAQVAQRDRRHLAQVARARPYADWLAADPMRRNG